MLKVINSGKAAQPLGAYSQAIVATSNTFIYCAGQVGIDPSTGKLVAGLENQTHMVISNIEEILAAANSDLKHIVKTTIFAKNEDNLRIINTIYASYFHTNPPARTRLIVDLPHGAEVLIEVVAIPKE